ncbi:hydrogenase nickel incorporation protein HypA [Desulfoluna limicola]|uniref:Hydrogenase maturation factor HypA n=1 Tax=Desulfoluna limicola TaxID=2810562 RepID=A0ABM7PC75_9BACT|nr:hydrogenase maturation nickel metallochaperone HypA [Desulfoluna limicola]BCS95147.1 hydrogenase nickel incorporation protein HypA [Desulfoluna limicola]
MHELGVVIKVVKNVEDFARKNGVTNIETLVLQIGALASVIPRFVENCYPMAVKGTMLEDTRLKIEVLPANARCRACETVFNALKHKSVCPHCSGGNPEMISGNEFMIKEIVAC